MAVIAKFKVNRVGTRADHWTRKADGAPCPYFNIVLGPVGDGSKENKEFFKWSPGGEIDLWTTSKEYAEKFQVGAEFYVRFYREGESETGHRFRVRTIGNEQDDGSQKLYNVELRSYGEELFSQAHIKLSTINANAAVDFLGFGEIRVTLEPATVANAVLT